jgi:DNA invertase Pin-like site-specific DNA recombinase
MSDTKKKQAIAYYRVSTSRQDFERQKLDVFEYCNKHDYKIKKTVQCKVSSSGKRKERGIEDLIGTINEPKSPRTIVFAELSRLGRSLREILELVDEFVQGNGCRLIFVKENLVLDKEVTDIASEVMLTIFALLAQLEKRLIRERIKSALSARKAAGVILGRPKMKSKLDTKEDEIRGMVKIGIKQKFIAKKIDCTEATLSNWMKRKRREWAVDDS